MTDIAQQLLALLKERSFKLGTFRLASGKTSNHYIDGKMSAVFSAGAYLIGEVIYEHTRDMPIEALGGLEVGAVPLTAAAVIAYHSHGRVMEGFWVRDKVKDHGTKKMVEGGLRPGARVAIIEDVATSGGSALKAIEEVQALGCQVALVLTIVDRLQGAAEKFAERGLPYKSVFTIRDFGVEPDHASLTG